MNKKETRTDLVNEIESLTKGINTVSYIDQSTGKRKINRAGLRLPTDRMEFRYFSLSELTNIRNWLKPRLSKTTIRNICIDCLSEQDIPAGNVIRLVAEHECEFYTDKVIL
jgi:hypothetical protein